MVLHGMNVAPGTTVDETGPGRLVVDATGKVTVDTGTVFELPGTLPEIAASPTAQGIVDALVTLGLVTQAT